MSTRTKAALAAAIALWAFAGFLLYRDHRRMAQQQAATTATRLLPELDPARLQSITIQTADAQTRLRLHDGRWTVAGQHGYYANGARVTDLVEAVGRLRALQSFGVAPRDRGTLALNDPAAAKHGTGTRFVFRRHNDDIAAEFIVGAPARTADDGADSATDARYLLLPDRGSVMLVPGELGAFSADWLDWLDWRFPQVPDVRRITRRRDVKRLWQVARTEAEAPLRPQAPLPPEHEPHPDRMARLGGMLNGATFSAVGDPARDADTWGFGDHHLDVQAADGLTWTFTLGRKTTRGRLPVTIRAAAADGNTATAERAAGENEFYNGWVYLLPRATYAPMLYDRDDLLRPTPARDE